MADARLPSIIDTALFPDSVAMATKGISISANVFGKIFGAESFECFTV
jgi:hypothetical protein